VRVVAAGDVDANAVAGAEQVARRERFDADQHRPPRFERRRRFQRARSLLTDADACGFLLVLIPETLPILDLQRIRAAIRAAGLITAVPIELGGDSVHRCDWRWAEVEPYLQLPSVGQSVNADSRLFRGLGQLHRVLATLADIATTDLRRSFVGVETLHTWVGLNVAGRITNRRMLCRMREPLGPTVRLG
jgi:hypothetical protein